MIAGALECRHDRSAKTACILLRREELDVVVSYLLSLDPDRQTLMEMLKLCPSADNAMVWKQSQWIGGGNRREALEIDR